MTQAAAGGGGGGSGMSKGDRVRLLKDVMPGLVGQTGDIETVFSDGKVQVTLDQKFGGFLVGPTEQDRFERLSATSAGVAPTSPQIPAIADPSAVARDLYDLYRRSRLNVKYYGEKLGTLQRISLGIDIAVALGTSGTLLAILKAVPSLTISLGTIAAVLGVLKPILNLPTRIEGASKNWSDYQGVFTAAQRLVRKLQAERRLDPTTVPLIEDMHAKMDLLFGRDDPAPRRDVLDRLQREVQEELPAKNWWDPPTPGSS
ncbi:MAG: hypothetical protein QOF78_650 [Phycisphaerales bacterium]|jgi:hypothetical protein|nr:hypothetical protein [Phycisphaerales bacterium]